MNLNDKHLLDELVVESKEHLAAIEPDLLELEKSENVPKETINRVFRAVHSIKGGFSFFGLKNIKQLSHSMENVMMRVRDGELTVNPGIIDALFSGLDKLRVLIDDTVHSDTIPISEEIDMLVQFKNGESFPTDTTEAHNKTGESGNKASLNDLQLPPELLTKIAREGNFIYLVKLSSHEDLCCGKHSLQQFTEAVRSYGSIIKGWIEHDNITGLNDCLSVEVIFVFVITSVLEPELFQPAIEVSPGKMTTFSKETIRYHLQVTTMKKEKTSGPAASDTTAITPPEKQNESTETIRVKVPLLNSLVNLAGELVLSRNQLLERIKNIEEAGLKNILTDIDMVTSELQENIMSTRMQPLGSIFGKFPRLIRDLSKNLGKEVDLTLKGEHVELDKSIIEALADPLTHLLRNCVDHGIEKPEIRQKAGKPSTGSILLSAYHEGGQVNIEIRDDGKGIDTERVKKTAMENGIISAEDTERLTDQEIFELIFEPGFSTAEVVTDVSGRGVGMDVVKTNIESLAGNIDISSERDHGTTITLRLPLTLAIVPALIISCEERRFAIPQVSLDELVRLHAKEASHRIEKVQDKDVLRLRDRLLPLIRLTDILDITPTFIDPETGKRLEDKRRNLADRRQLAATSEEMLQRRNGRERRQSSRSAINIVVLKVGTNQYGLIVDRMIDSEEIVVKPLSSYIKNCKCYSGATIMGDGHVAMILDPTGIAESANLKFNELADENRRQSDLFNRQTIRESQSFLVFGSRKEEQMALNLSLVSRIETITSDAIETVGTKEYIRHGNSTMRIIRPEQYMPIRKQKTENNKLYVIIPKLVKQPIGIITTRIIDVIDSSDDLDTTHITGTGIHGSMIINEKLVLVVDIYSLFEKAEPDVYKKNLQDKSLKGKRILLAEDTSFFRTIETSYFESMGCIVESVTNGKEALDRLEHGSFDIVVTDLIMPEMNGFELIQHIKEKPVTQHIPVIALTTLKDSTSIEQCTKAGADAFGTKFDKEDLLKTMQSIFSVSSVRG
jgi:two-component system, chemotaxis family, sensor kinase CheA